MINKDREEFTKIAMDAFKHMDNNMPLGINFLPPSVYGEISEMMAVFHMKKRTEVIVQNEDKLLREFNSFLMKKGQPDLHWEIKSFIKKR